LETTRLLKRILPQTKVLILTLHESEQLIREVLDAGAMGFLLKSDAARDLVTAVDSLRQNRAYFTTRVASMVLSGYLNNNGARSV
jgi:DNA-binding NarL/FixJ family response regulator